MKAVAFLALGKWGTMILIVRCFVYLPECAKGRFIYLTRSNDDTVQHFIHVLNYVSGIRIMCKFASV